jgi:succinyl-diaminopimelate desuccinylase
MMTSTKSQSAELGSGNLRYLADLVAMQTLTHDHKVANQALDYVEKALTKHASMFSKRYEWEGYGAIVATTRDTKKPTVMLLGHLDVVPGHAGHFSLVRKGNKLTGRGVYDMKFAIAAYLQLVDDLRTNLSDYDFGIMLTTDEEAGGKNGTPRLLEEGYRTDVCVVPDGGLDWKLEVFAKGMVRATIEVVGKSAHGSRPWEGDSASLKIVSLLHEMQKLFDHNDRYGATLNVGMLSSGHAINKIPHEASAEIDIRFPSDESLQIIKIAIDNLLPKYNAHWHSFAVESACINDPENPHLQRFAAIVKSVTGIDTGHHRSFGASDARYFSELGIPCIITQPPGGSSHTDDEWLDMQGFSQFQQVLRQFIEQTARKIDD